VVPSVGLLKRPPLVFSEELPNEEVLFELPSKEKLRVSPEGFVIVDAVPKPIGLFKRLVATTGSAPV